MSSLTPRSLVPDHASPSSSTQSSHEELSSTLETVGLEDVYDVFHDFFASYGDQLRQIKGFEDLTLDPIPDNAAPVPFHTIVNLGESSLLIQVQDLLHWSLPESQKEKYGKLFREKVQIERDGTMTTQDKSLPLRALQKCAHYATNHNVPLNEDVQEYLVSFFVYRNQYVAQLSEESQGVL